MTVLNLGDMLAELKELWQVAEHGGLNVKAKKEAAAAVAEHQRVMVATIVAAVDEARRVGVADELALHAQHYWDMSAMYERTRDLAEKSGEEGSGLIAEATMQVCRDVAKRLKARAGEVAGIDPVEAAFREEAAAERHRDESGGGG